MRTEGDAAKQKLTIEEIEATQEQLRPYVLETPIKSATSFSKSDVTYKQELFQHTGTFKARGAFSVMLDLDSDQLASGVTAVSAGNHAIATAYAAKRLGASAKLVMPDSANPIRIKRAEELGAEVVLAGDVNACFDEVERIRSEESRFFVHPFDSYRTVLGTATCGLEFITQAPSLEAVVVPIGGGGLSAGMAAAIKLAKPECEVYGVEPVGANSMSRSFDSGKPEAIDKVETIADSLGAPYALEYTFEICRQNIDQIVTVSDAELRNSMRFLFEEERIGCEPACAASTAALIGPLKEKLAGKKVGLILCGSNIDLKSWSELMQDVA